MIQVLWVERARLWLQPVFYLGLTAAMILIQWLLFHARTCQWQAPPLYYWALLNVTCFFLVQVYLCYRWSIYLFWVTNQTEDNIVAEAIKLKISKLQAQGVSEDEARKFFFD